MPKLKTDGYLQSALGRAERTDPSRSSSMELAPEIMYTEDWESGRTFAVSPEITTILGYTPEEWMGEADLCLDRIHPEDRDRVVAACELANEAEALYRAEYRMIARDGHIVWIRDQAILVRGSNGQPLCWQGVMRDISAERQNVEPAS